MPTGMLSRSLICMAPVRRIPLFAVRRAPGQGHSGVEHERSQQDDPPQKRNRTGRLARNRQDGKQESNEGAPDVAHE